MNIKELLNYTKEELAMYILRNCFGKDIKSGMESIHIQFLLDNDAKLTETEHEKEVKLLHKIQSMPHVTFEDNYKRLEMFEKYKKLSERNTSAYNKRQAEIDKLIKN